MSMDLKFNYIAITNEIQEALILDYCGIQQIMVDCENIGKIERQKNKNTVINFHKIEDVEKLKKAGVKAKIICRINGFHSKISDEIERAIFSGSDLLMIPMIQSISEFEFLLEKVNGRVAILPLIETPYSIFKISKLIELAKPRQLHFGLNDLSLSLGLKNIFEILVSQPFATAVSVARENVDLVGIGGIGDPLSRQLLSPRLLVNEYKILGGNSVILSRSFFSGRYNSEQIIQSLSLLEKYVLEERSLSRHKDLIFRIEQF